MSLEKGYANALFEITREQEVSGNVVVANLITVLKRKGHINLLAPIVSEYEKILSQGRDDKTMKVVCAKDSDFSKYKEEIKEHLEYSGAEFTDEVVDETIVGGYVLESGENVVDGSYKNKLLLLYQNAIA